MKPDGMGRYERLTPSLFYFCRMCKKSLKGRLLSTLYCLECEKKRFYVVSRPIQDAYRKRMRKMKNER